MKDFLNNKKEVRNLCVKTEDSNFDVHSFDTLFRSLVLAPSGSGKSNFITYLITLFCRGKGTYDNIYITCKCEFEPLYRLNQLLNQLLNKLLNQLLNKSLN